MTIFLTIEEVQQEYPLGRDLAHKLMGLLPHATIGPKRVIERGDLEALIRKAIANGEDLWDIAREYDRGKVLRWLRN